MVSFPFKVVAFDLDGTLADTAADLGAALNHALAALGREPIAAEAVRPMIGHGARALLHKGLEATGGASEPLVDRAFLVFLDHYRSNLATNTRAYPGLEAAMDELAGRGVALSVCTNKLESLTLGLLDALGWSARFHSVIGGDTLPVRKPDPAPLREAITRAGGGRAAFVGDSITDADTARAAAIPFVAVSFGFSDRPVDQLGADAVIDDYAALVGVLGRF